MAIFGTGTPLQSQTWTMYFDITRPRTGIGTRIGGFGILQAGQGSGEVM